MMRNTSSTRMGARPIEGSSSSTTSGFSITARAMASICCSPPDSVPASCVRRSFRRGKSPARVPGRPATSPRGRLPVKRGKAPSAGCRSRSWWRTRAGLRANAPGPAWRCGATPGRDALAAQRDLAAVGAIMPEMARMVVVLPAPLEPMSVTTLPLGTSIDAVQHLHLAVARADSGSIAS
jgi:hypothetical protein